MFWRNTFEHQFRCSFISFVAILFRFLRFLHFPLASFFSIYVAGCALVLLRLLNCLLKLEKQTHQRIITFISSVRNIKCACCFLLSGPTDRMCVRIRASTSRLQDCRCFQSGSHLNPNDRAEPSCANVTHHWIKCVNEQFSCFGISFLSFAFTFSCFVMSMKWEIQIHHSRRYHVVVAEMKW